MYAQKMQPNKDGKVGEGVHFERIRRITGYLVGTMDRFNNGKKAECLDRVKHLKVQPKSCKRYKIKNYSPLKIGGYFVPILYLNLLRMAYIYGLAVNLKHTKSKFHHIQTQPKYKPFCSIAKSC